MKQGIVLALMGLAAGLVLAGNFAEGQGQSEAPDRAWPPSASESIVNETGSKSFKRPGEIQVIYTVPEDRWLVITGFRTIKKLKELFPKPNLIWRKAGAKQGTLVIPWQLSAPAYSSGSAVGLRFPPGCEVALKRDASGTSRLSCFYFFSGYLTE